VLAHYRHLADGAAKPMILYHVPGRTNVGIPLETAARLFEHPNVAGIKEASGNYSYWLGLAQIARDTGKTVYAGDDDAFVVQQAFGGRGLISACANAVPGPLVKMHRLMLEGRWPEAFELQLRIAPLVRAFFAETNPAPVKYALHRFRGMADTLRLPLLPVTEPTQRLIEREWDRFHSGYEA
jgi:4-hydroxy-tetrahydrodipicolinate synthase